MVSCNTSESATPLEWRLDDAAKSGTPWQFAFVLRGGWTLAREQFNALRDFDRADLLLVLIAARQLLSLDAGSEVETIVSDSQAMGRSEEWARSGIELLRRQKAVLPNIPLRCLHIQSAIVIINTALKRRDTDTFQPIVASLRRMVYDPTSSVRGISWLNEHVLGADAFRYSSSRDEDRFFGRSQLEQLLTRLLASTAAVARRDAAFVLSRLLWYRELEKERLRAAFSTLREWLETATGENCYALGDLVSSIRYGGEASYGELVSSMEPSAVWRRLETLEPSSGYSWGHFLNRLAYAGGSAWRKQVLGVAARDRLFDLIDRFTAREIEDLSELIEGLASFDSALGLECLRRALPALKAAFAADALAAYRATSDLEHRLLGHPLFSTSRPSKGQKEVSREFTDAIRPENVASGIATCRFGDWETYARLLHFVQRVNSEKHRAIVAAMSWDALERRSLGFWSHPRREFRLLLSNLTTRKNGEPVRAWIFQHSKLIQEIDPIFTGLSPESAVAVLGHGGRVNLAGHNGSDWRLQTWALAKVAEINPSAACEILRANEAHVAGRLSKLEGIDAEEFPEFLKLARELDHQWFTDLVGKIDLESAADKWPRVLRDERVAAKKGAERTLGFVIEEGEGAAQDLADSLLSDRRVSQRPAEAARAAKPRKRRKRNP
jgi:hypothetical protein